VDLHEQFARPDRFPDLLWHGPDDATGAGPNPGLVERLNDGHLFVENAEVGVLLWPHRADRHAGLVSRVRTAVRGGGGAGGVGQSALSDDYCPGPGSQADRRQADEEFAKVHVWSPLEG